ncbi:esterase [Marinithermofilum abyssi]|uniref:Esterase n=1 Tax=Marinithermofilum abyssi TaxID=1571185 RepID=A0A8J2VCT6_9BACL|nr:PaaI family thioesterase [Marinithermofilum abyssi]GGE15459.1 esterase [Marinithermofilum abyssi]
MGDGKMNGEEFNKLIQYFRKVPFWSHIRCQIDEVEEGTAQLHITLENFHLNGNATAHGGVLSTLMDNAMGLAVRSVSGWKTATTQMNVYFLAPAAEGKMWCRGEVIHQTRRTVTARATVTDDRGELIATGTGSFRVFRQPDTSPN